MTDLENWSLKIKEERRGDEVRLSFELYEGEDLRKKWGQIVHLDQVDAAIKMAKRHAKAFAQNYNVVKEYEVSLDDEDEVS